MDYKIAVSKSGYNVLTETNPNSFIFNSDYNTFKIISSNTYSFSIPTNYFTEDYTETPHNLNYIPFVIAFCKFNDGRVGLVGSVATDIFPTKTVAFTNLSVNPSTIRFFYANNSGSDYPVIFRYYIFEAPVTL